MVNSTLLMPMKPSNTEWKLVLNHQCSGRILNLLNSVVNLQYLCVGVYKSMHSVEQQEQWRAGNERPRRCQLHFRRGCNIRCYDFPTSNEVAAVFFGNGGMELHQ